MTKALGEQLHQMSVPALQGLDAAPWVDALLNKHWEAIVEATPEGALPEIRKVSRSGKVVASELGCGHYGCVLPTTDPNLVCKVTSDESEAFFIACALTIGEQPEGIVQYLQVNAFPGTSKRRERPTFILWRETAHDVGVRGGWARAWGIDTKTHYDKENVEEIQSLLELFKLNGDMTRKAFLSAKSTEHLRVEAAKQEDWAWDWARENFTDMLHGAETPAGFVRGYPAAKRFAFGLETAKICIEHMGNTYRCDSVGRALGFYLEHGLLMCDVHSNNLGRVHRAEGSDGGAEPLVITDPGHALALDDRWSKVKIEEL